MKFLCDIFKTSPEFARFEKLVNCQKTPAAINGVAHIHKAMLIASYCSIGKKAVVVTSDEAECTRLSEDLKSLGCKSLGFPARDFTFRDMSGYSHEYEHRRTATLSRILEGDFDVVLVAAGALGQLTIPKKRLKDYMFKISSGETLEPEELCKRLLNSGYTRCDTVDGTGQFAVRGGIIDFYAPNLPQPLRVDFWDNEIDRISFIDISSQRSVKNQSQVSVCPAAEVFCSDRKALAEKLLDFLNSGKKITEKAKARIIGDINSLKSDVFVPLDRYLKLLFDTEETLLDYLFGLPVFISEGQRVDEKLRSAEWINSEDTARLFEEGFLCDGLDKYCLQPFEIYKKLESGKTVYLENFNVNSYELKPVVTESFNMQQSSFWGGSAATLADDLSAVGKESKYVILAGAERSARVLCRELSEYKVNAVFLNEPKEIQAGVTVTAGGLSAGFSLPSLKFTVITQGKTRGGTKHRVSSRKDAKPYNSLEELHDGDYVVHAAHGIGVFDGIHSMTVQGIKKDYIKIKYAGQDVLYVPVTQLDLVSKYIGAREDSGVKLHKLGGSEWTKTRARVRRAVKDMAKQLTVLYAKRMSLKGFAFSPDGDLQADFESRFEYDETDDQLRCAAEIKGDMERAVPMDRLLCGDVGFGKTEVALRAAFKCIADGKQCAILVPTTILAWQHYNTATERFGTLPVNVEMISRFRTKRQQTDILRRLKNGEIDLLIGTHRLISKDVVFRDPGLIIVDEEQRFGVGQKEKLKELFPQIDVLTLTATPIPRTLNMAMTGLRDMSVIEEAPQDRHPVQTYVLEQDDGVLSDAIERELRRGGQVYYLHNRVESIEACALRLKSRFPDASIAIAHGKMDEDTLSRVWKRLIEHEVDILVCTTIIETGVDVPNANTLIIEDADRMGLAQLHQLRGRVGRSSRRAYAYLCFRRGRALSDIAAKRLNAIRDFTEFGSGFKIAMRDLEIRGAGSILGGEQHGHMEAVGYDMYLKLLSDAVAEEKGEQKPKEQAECLVDIAVPAHIPEQYITSLPARLGIYRRIADIKTESDREDVTDELIDRFGEPPRSVLALCDISLIRARAAELGITEIAQRERNLLLYVADIKSESVAKACSALRGRSMLSAGAKPYISVRMDTSGDVIKQLKEIMDAMTTENTQNHQK